MFYQEQGETALRFGDVLRGFVLTASSVKNPELIGSRGYSITVETPIYSVVLSPCCSIGDKVISLTPLVPLRARFFDNPYFVADLTRINRRMAPEQTLSLDEWQQLPPERRQTLESEGDAYAFLELFVYEQHGLFTEYPVHRKAGDVNTKYYMIDFRNTHKVNCDKIASAKQSPLNLKCLQLSVSTRADLREKLAFYYGRAAPEDEALLDE